MNSPTDKKIFLLLALQYLQEEKTPSIPLSATTKSKVNQLQP